jgi:uncharacterized protein YqiB (DUF1249 family)
MLLELDSFRSVHTITPSSFSGLMDLYEQNYLRFRKLVPDLSIADQMISSVPGHSDLYLSVKLRCKYTTMLSMTYRFEKSGHYLFEPDLHFKVYHDARVVEVQHLLKRHYGLVENDRLMQHKWEMNRFLFKWLGFCLFQGHYFQPMKPYNNNINNTR